jgi:hypothetical protein
MTLGTLFTLFVVPVFYSLLAAKHEAEPAEEPETRPESAPKPELVLGAA